MSKNIDTETFTKIFLRFLKENHCFSKYQRALFEAYKERANIKFHELLIRETEKIINDSFIWAHTREGHNYWQFLNYKFKNICRSIKISKFAEFKNLKTRSP